MLFTGVITVPGFSSLGLVGIACGDIVFYGLMLIVLLVILIKRRGGFGLGKLVIACFKVTIATLIGGVVAELASWGIASVIDISNILGSFIALMITGIIGLGVIFVMCRILDVNEVTDFAHRLVRRLGRK